MQPRKSMVAFCPLTIELFAKQVSNAVMVHEVFLFRQLHISPRDVISTHAGDCDGESHVSRRLTRSDKTKRNSICDFHFEWLNTWTFAHFSLIDLITERLNRRRRAQSSTRFTDKEPIESNKFSHGYNTQSSALIKSQKRQSPTQTAWNRRVLRYSRARIIHQRGKQ